MNDATPQRPPVAARKPSTVTHHGITVADHYAWLRDPGYPEVTDQEVLAHLAAENAWFEARMAPHQGTIEALFKEMRARIKEADKSVPQKDGDWLYWIEFEEGAEYKKWWRKPVAGGADELILDEPALAEGKEYFRLGAISTSKDGRLLAYSVDDNGSERFTARIKDLATGEHLPDEIPGHAVVADLGRGRYRPDLLARQRAVAHRQRPAALARQAHRGRRRALPRG
jgi:oligopeptidase B